MPSVLHDPVEDRRHGWTDEYITMNNEADFMNRAGVTAEWDEETCQNYAEWTSGNATYQIWLEDAESMQ